MNDRENAELVRALELARALVRGQRLTGDELAIAAPLLTAIGRFEPSGGPGPPGWAPVAEAAKKVAGATIDPHAEPGPSTRLRRLNKTSESIVPEGDEPDST